MISKASASYIGAGTIYDLFAQVLVLEELSRASARRCHFIPTFFSCRFSRRLRCGADGPIREEYQKTGRLAFALAVSEPSAGSDTMGMKTAVSLRDDALVLNGVKSFVNNGEYAPALLVAAIDEEASAESGEPTLSLWLIPRDLEGIRVVPEDKIGQSMLPFASILFDNVVLDESYRLRGDAKGFSQLFKFFEFGRVFVCATALGQAQAAMEDAVRWAQARSAFGASIASFQQIQQMLTDMEVKLANMRNLVYQAAWEFDRGEHDRLTVAMMKRYVPATATEVASDAMQILGGRGYTSQERVSSIWQDCRGFQIAEGTDQIMVHIAAPLIMKKYEG
ncbi:MAG: acyl-CoA dehydrogenase family protein [Slackia sp.]